IGAGLAPVSDRALRAAAAAIDVRLVAVLRHVATGCRLADAALAYRRRAVDRSAAGLAALTLVRAAAAAILVRLVAVLHALGAGRLLAYCPAAPPGRAIGAARASLIRQAAIGA